MHETILVVEDEQTMRETLAYNLEKQGYKIAVAGDGQTAIDQARKINPDLIILDIMIPGIDGFDVCRTLRKDKVVPIIMLTARDDEIDRVVGLEVGADDYITKPFSMRELLARVKALLRRVQYTQDKKGKEQDPHIVHVFENLIINETRREVTLNRNPIELKPKEYDLLVYFAMHKGRVLTREKILADVWGWDFFGDSRTVDVHVRWLREKIEANPANPTRILTLRGTGYRFEE